MKIYSNFNENNIKQLKDRCVVVIGCFDGVHLGHQEIFKTALKIKRPEEKLCVFTFNTSSFAPVKKADTLKIITNSEKYYLFEKMGVDVCFCPSFEDVSNLSTEQCVYLILKQFLNAKAVVVGTDFRFGKNASGDINILSTLCNNAGIVCKIVDKISLDEKIISSSQIREYITTGNIEKANQMLGYNFFYFCKVITGNKIGRTLNFPTINQKIEPNKISPPFGVYLSSVEIEFKTYCGITNIGIKPTVGSNYPLCETYVDGFDGNLYDKIIKTSIIKKIRNEKKFDNLDQLKNQISIDCKIAKEYFKNI